MKSLRVLTISLSELSNKQNTMLNSLINWTEIVSLKTDTKIHVFHNHLHIAESLLYILESLQCRSHDNPVDFLLDERETDLTEVIADGMFLPRRHTCRHIIATLNASLIGVLTLVAAAVFHEAHMTQLRGHTVKKDRRSPVSYITSSLLCW